MIRFHPARSVFRARLALAIGLNMAIASVPAAWATTIDDLTGNNNAAGLEISVAPSGEIAANEQIQFTISTQKRGYLILILLDAGGAAKQIYPALTGDELPFGTNDDLNLIKPNKQVLVPDPRNPMANFEFYATLPGKATIIALLSSAPVQIVDLSELPADQADNRSAVDRIFETVSTLQILPRDEKTAVPAKNWSIKAVEYLVK